mmetsp:Transcript_4464/g.28421  ORF Transcript_4464/g.28421 Transcript_4464/m.28421 type:complete len:83 (-) Transcript_4464:704-952(-)
MPPLLAKAWLRATKCTCFGSNACSSEVTVSLLIAGTSHHVQGDGTFMDRKSMDEDGRQPYHRRERWCNPSRRGGTMELALVQ